MPIALASNTPRAGFKAYCAINPIESGKGLQWIQKKANKFGSIFNNHHKDKSKQDMDELNDYLRNARAKSSMDSLIPIDSIIPPSAGAYISFDTLFTSSNPRSSVIYKNEKDIKPIV